MTNVRERQVHLKPSGDIWEIKGNCKEPIPKCLFQVLGYEG